MTRLLIAPFATLQCKFIKNKNYYELLYGRKSSSTVRLHSFFNYYCIIFVKCYKQRYTFIVYPGELHGVG